MKKIVITGATGLVATELIYSYLLKSVDQLFLLSTHPNDLKPRFISQPNVTCLSLDEFVDGRYDGWHFDVVVHTAFARSGKGADYVSSLEYLRRLLFALRKTDLNTFINISSQSVYGDASMPLWKEDAPLGPTDNYAMAKAASEMIVKMTFEDTDVNWTNVRLSSICENARFLRIFVQNAIEGKPIRVQGGSQMCSFLDVRDAACGLYAMIEKCSDIHLSDVYNLGNGLQYTIKEVAEIVKKVGEQDYNLKICVEITPSNLTQNVGMNSGLFQTQFGWAFKYDMLGMIKGLFEMLTNVSGDEFPISFKIKYLQA